MVVAAHRRMFPVEPMRDMSRAYLAGLGLAEGRPIWLTLVGGLAADRPLNPAELRVTRRVLGWAGWTDDGHGSWWRAGSDGREPIFTVPPAPGKLKSRHQIVCLAMCAKPAGPVVYTWPQQWLVSYTQTMSIERPILAGVALGGGES